MKKGPYLSFVLTLLVCCFISANGLAVKKLHDTFSGTYLDGQRWEYRDFVRKIAGGKLVLKIANDRIEGTVRNNLNFQDPENINAIECKITVVAAALDVGDEPVAFARIGGVLYNARNSGGATGDIWAEIQIGDRGNGLEAFWTVEEIADDVYSDSTMLHSGTLIPPGLLKLGTAYTVRLSYDGNTGIEAEAAGKGDTFTGPERQRPAVGHPEGGPLKQLATGIDADSGSGKGYVSALFDDIYINNQATAYDTFDKAPIDPNRWTNQERVREISNGKLQMHAQGCNQRGNVSLILAKYDNRYLEAKVLIEGDSQVPAGKQGLARMAGWYYNDSRGPGSGQDYNGYEGDVWVSNRIVVDNDGQLKAFAGVWRSGDAEGITGDEKLWQQFPVTIDYNTEYTLSIEFDGNTITFRCDDAMITYKVDSPMYAPSEAWIGLQSRVYADPGECGYMKAYFDDVYVYPADIEDFVTRFYRLCLGRDPDLAGLTGWVKALLDGSQTGSDVAFGFVFSEEFLKKNTTPDEYLQVLYEAFFDRQPDPAGKQGWLDAMQSGATREDVLKGYIFAVEFAELCDQYGIKAYEGHFTKAQREAVEAFVTRFYQLCLDRDPDTAGLNGWTDNLLNQIQTGADVAEGFIYSSEFIAKMTSNSQYLEILYLAFFDRDADPAGWNIWLDELDGGRDRGEVLNGFIYSQEFAELCQRFGITPYQ
jgi:hypothetical protein